MTLQSAYGRARQPGIGAYLTRPESHREWIERYNWLDDWYHGVDYTLNDVQYLKLFFALAGENSDTVIASTSRITRDAQYVVDTDANILAGGRWSLQMARGAASRPLMAQGEAVWHRSALQVVKGQWVRGACIHGDSWLEAIRERGRDGRVYTRIVQYDARHCTPHYAPDGVTLQRLHVKMPYFDDVETTVLNVYERVIDANGVIATEMMPNGERRQIPQETGPHNLGVVPCVHLRHQPIPGYPEHSLWAGNGLDRPMQSIDSMYAQLRAIAQRYAHPHMIFTGIEPDGMDFESFGRAYVFNNPEAKAQYLEAGMGALAPINDSMRQYNNEIRGTIPEFIMGGAGANTSGRALEMRASALKFKMREIGSRHAEAVSRVTEYAVAMMNDDAYDASVQLYRVGMPPILPVDEPTTIRLVNESIRDGTLKRVDGVRALQRVGLIDEEEDAEAYAAALEADRQLTPAAAPDTTSTNSEELDE